MVYEVKNPEAAASLFSEWDETLIWSCLQGVMGKLYADSPEAPVSCMAMLGDFCFFAGRPGVELAAYKPGSCKNDFMIMVPQNESWAELIEAYYGGKAKRTVRYATKKEKGVFDIKQLDRVVDGLPEEYTLQMIDEEMFQECKCGVNSSWCRDFVSQYKDFQMYQKYGLGAVITKDNEIVSGASSYSGYIGGIEIEIDTKGEYRRRGLAHVCGAKLILECIKLGLYPSWDAQNKWSLTLAEKLGYHFDHEYPVYEIWGY